MPNRLVTTADANGDICVYTSTATALIVDINGIDDDAITPIDNQRSDTRVKWLMCDGSSPELHAEPRVNRPGVWSDGASAVEALRRLGTTTSCGVPHAAAGAS